MEKVEETPLPYKSLDSCVQLYRPTYIAILFELQTFAVQIPDFLKKSGILAFTNHLGLL